MSFSMETRSYHNERFITFVPLLLLFSLIERKIVLSSKYLWVFLSHWVFYWAPPLRHLLISLNPMSVAFSLILSVNKLRKKGESQITTKQLALPTLMIVKWRRAWQPTPVFLPGESRGQKSLAGYSPRGHKKLDRTEWLSTAQHNW